MTREQLVTAILDFLAPQETSARAETQRSLEKTIDAAGADALPALRERLLADAGWDYYPPDPLARRIHHLLAGRFLHADSALQGDIHLAPLVRGRTVLLANHLSYADANVIEVLLRRAGADTMANRMTAIAGPKVFTNRRLPAAYRGAYTPGARLSAARDALDAARH